MELCERQCCCRADSSVGSEKGLNSLELELDWGDDDFTMEFDAESEASYDALFQEKRALPQQGQQQQQRKEKVVKFQFLKNQVKPLSTQ